MQFILALFLCVMLVSCAHSDEASHRQAAEELLTVTEMREEYNLTLNHYMKPVAPEYRDATRAFYSKYLGWDDVKNDYAKILLDNFSERELKEMIVFYKTPIGKKFIAFNPTFATKGLEMSTQRVAPHWAELKAELKILKNQHKKKKHQSKKLK